ncbi:unnamed protein product [Gadus morhua 'NCC']
MQSPLGTPPPCPTHQFETPSPLDPVHPAPGHQRSHPRAPSLQVHLRRFPLTSGERDGSRRGGETCDRPSEGFFCSSSGRHMTPAGRTIMNK